jgi:hypothetical protein
LRAKLSSRSPSRSLRHSKTTLRTEILDTDTTVFIPLETLERLAQQFDGNLHLRYRDTDGYKTRLEHVVDDALADRFGVRKT